MEEEEGPPSWFVLARRGGVAAEGMAEQGAVVVGGDGGQNPRMLVMPPRTSRIERRARDVFIACNGGGAMGRGRVWNSRGRIRGRQQRCLQKHIKLFTNVFNVLFVSHKQCSSSLFHFGWKNTLRLKLRHTVTLCNRDDKKRDYMLGLKQSHQCRWYELRSRVQLNIVITDLN